MNRLLFLVLFAVGCGASGGDADDSEDVDEGALGACSECSSASDLLAKSVVVEVVNGGTDSQQKEFRDMNTTLAKMMAAGIKDLPPVDDAPLGPNLKKDSLRFLTTTAGASLGPTEGAVVAVHGALAQALYGLSARSGNREGAPSCRIAAQPSVNKAGNVDGASCEWKLPAARVKIEAVRRGELTDKDVARLVNLAYEPRK